MEEATALGNWIGGNIHDEKWMRRAIEFNRPFGPSSCQPNHVLPESRLWAGARTCTGSFQSSMTEFSCDTFQPTVMEFTSSLSPQLPVSDELGSHRPLLVYFVLAACTKQD